MKTDRQLPEWAPPGGGAGFAAEVVPGVLQTGQSTVNQPKPAVKRRVLSEKDYVDGVLAGDRAILGRAITLVESSHPAAMEMARHVLQELHAHRVEADRVGITGVPGAGKSTFIEALGTMLCERGRKVAVLAVDPSSIRSGGSILGDKTRMEKLAHHPNAFIRPSPSGGTLGGVARKSRECILLCEAAGFSTILVETVGVGQSEVVVRSMVDFFLILALAGAGDELQGMKKGIIELADMIVVNKCDGDNVAKVKAAKAEYERVLPLLRPATEGWPTPVYAASAVTGCGMEEIWRKVEEFFRLRKAAGLIQARRQEQDVAWLKDLLNEALRRRFEEHPRVREIMPGILEAVAQGRTTPVDAVENLLSQVRDFG